MFLFSLRIGFPGSLFEERVFTSGREWFWSRLWKTRASSIVFFAEMVMKSYVGNECRRSVEKTTQKYVLERSNSIFSPCPTIEVHTSESVSVEIYKLRFWNLNLNVVHSFPKEVLAYTYEHWVLVLSVQIYLFHFSFLPKNNPKYLTVSDVGIRTLLRVMFGHTRCLSLN